MNKNIIEINSLQEFLDLAKEEQMTEEEKVLREFIRRELIKEIKAEEQQEFELRKIIRNLLKEGDISDIHPHRSTAINALEDVLKKMIPTLRKDYKNLTTDKTQRESFRAHILKAMSDIVAPAMNNAKYASGGALLSEPSNLGDSEKPESNDDDDLDAELQALEEVEIDITDDEDPIEKPEEDKKLNVEPDDEPDEKEEFGIQGMDETGRNMAYTTFRKVSQYILDTFDMLANPKDKEVFIDYLLTNSKLYFDKFEDELQNTVQEPDSPEA